MKTEDMADSDIDVLLEFLKMPLGSSSQVFNKFLEIPNAILRGSGLEQFLYIRGTRQNKVLFVAHADTYWDKHYGSSQIDLCDLSLCDGIIRNKNGGLGADDRAGCAIIWLLKDLGHSILITNGEEGGRLGSSWLMKENKDIADEINTRHQFVIQFDRKNGCDFKCYSVGTEAFREYIRSVTGYKEPDYTSYTDIVTLCRDIAGVNLSIGYRSEHSSNECVVINEWQGTLDICRNWLDAELLPKFALKQNFIKDMIESEPLPVSINKGKVLISASLWWVAIDGKPIGPHEESKLAELIANGRMNASTKVWKKGWIKNKDRWTIAGQVEELLDLFAPEIDKDSPFPIQYE